MIPSSISSILMLAILLTLRHQDRMPTATVTSLPRMATCQQAHREDLTFKTSACLVVCHLCLDLANQVSLLSFLQTCQLETGMAQRIIVAADRSDAAADHTRPMLVPDPTTVDLEILVEIVVDSVHRQAFVVEVPLAEVDGETEQLAVLQLDLGKPSKAEVSNPTRILMPLPEVDLEN